MIQHQAVIIGGGPAGLAAAVRLHEHGVRDIVILEREKKPGGILRQCIHDGFGLTRFGEALSGPEYAQRFVSAVEALHIPCITECTVVDLTAQRVVTASTRAGLLQIQAEVVILAMGCRERTRGALAIPGSRPSGVINAGVAQNYINLQNRMIGKEIVILGSGDIGLIMARRLTLEGAHVKAVYEVQPYPSGLPRNIEQCLNDYDIPLYLSHTVTDIHGRSRLTGVTVSQVDAQRRPIPGTQTLVPCDTLVLSVGLIPENELSESAGLALDPRTAGAVIDEHYQTTVPGIFSAGNVLHVHDLVDFVSLEAEQLADAAASYLRCGQLPACPLAIRSGKGVGHVVPQSCSGTADLTLSLRLQSPIAEQSIVVRQNGLVLARRKLKKALPAEMIRIPISKDSLDQSGDLEVAVE